MDSVQNVKSGGNERRWEKGRKTVKERRRDEREWNGASSGSHK